MWRGIFAVVLMFCLGCHKQPSRSPNQPLMVHGNGFDGVIFPAEKKMFGFGFKSESQSWTPSESDVALAERALPVYLQQLGTQDPRAQLILKQLSSYKRQYAGVVTDGQKEVFLSLFCHADGIDWATNEVIVMDGGTCFFQVYFSVTGKTFSRFTVNGRG
jgi:hypothetical protein